MTYILSYIFQKQGGNTLDKLCRLLSAKNRQILFCLLVVLLMSCLIGCSSVNIITPNDGATFASGNTVDFEGEVTRSMQTGGADRSDELFWESSLDGHIGDGESFSENTLSTGTHNITASWSSHNKSDSISIQINP